MPDIGFDESVCDGGQDRYDALICHRCNPFNQGMMVLNKPDMCKQGRKIMPAGK